MLWRWWRERVTRSDVVGACVLVAMVVLFPICICGFVVGLMVVML